MSDHDNPFGFQAWLTDWFGPPGTRFENNVWPILGLFVLALAGALAGILVAALSLH